MAKSKEQNVNVGPFMGIMGVVVLIFLAVVFLNNRGATTNDPIGTTEVEPTPSKLEKCIEEAETEYERIMILNSEPAPQEGYPDAREWNDREIAERTEDGRRKDKELCIKLYKD